MPQGLAASVTHDQPLELQAPQALPARVEKELREQSGLDRVEQTHTGVVIPRPEVPAEPEPMGLMQTLGVDPKPRAGLRAATLRADRRKPVRTRPGVCYRLGMENLSLELARLRDTLQAAGGVVGVTPAGERTLYFGNLVEEYQALTTGVGLVNATGRTHIEVTGEDRARFLHNLCTNDIKQLADGQACEACLLNVKGHVLGHGYILCQGESLWLDTVPGQGERWVSHLDRYLIREKVVLSDQTPKWASFWLVGPQAPQFIQQTLGAALPAERLASTRGKIVGAEVTLLRFDLAPPSASAGLPAAMVWLPSTHAADAWQALRQAGARACGWQAWEAVRIEAALPEFGQDISEENLPQELARDRWAISFNKGCYLGQETVARLDALGHVNQELRRLRFAGDIAPEPGLALTADDKSAGRVTSSVWSPAAQGPVALGYVRRNWLAGGTRLQSARGEAQVVG